MDRKTINNQLRESHSEFTQYINSLSEDELISRFEDKWSPSEQLDHILRGVRPLARLLQDKQVLEDRFGRVGRENMSFDELVSFYHKGLATGAKAFGPFIPEANEVEKRGDLIQNLHNSVESLIRLLDDYTDNEFDQLVIPHPLLGQLSIREMMYFTIYHVGHHHLRTKQNVEKLNESK